MSAAMMFSLSLPLPGSRSPAPRHRSQARTATARATRAQVGEPPVSPSLTTAPAAARIVWSERVVC